MRTVSASIVVLAGALILSIGSMVSHGDTQATLQLIGGAVGGYGLVVWHTEMRKPAGGSSHEPRT